MWHVTLRFCDRHSACMSRLFSYVLYASPIFNHPSNTPRVQIMKTLVTNSSPASCYFLPVRPKYFLLPGVRQPKHFTSARDEMSTDRRITRNTTSSSLVNQDYLSVVRGPEFEVHHLFLSSTEVNNTWSYPILYHMS